MEDIKLEIPRVPNDPISLNLKNGDQLFIVGANGFRQICVNAAICLRKPER